ncbi:MAG TPA: DUF929 family protein [Mycobacteriales bacterium]|nr:DUF929 family protein [Mycobacteriales bacterium]
MSSGKSKRPQARKDGPRKSSGNAGKQPAKSGAAKKAPSRPPGGQRPGARTSGWSASAQQRRDQQRQRMMMAGIGIGVVIVLVVALVLVKTLGGSGGDKKITADASKQAITAVSTLPAATLDKVGAGSYTYEKDKVGLQAVSGTPMKVTGDKPTIVYLGAEFCPYCAAQRWPLTIALSRFGKFTGLKTTTSAGNDVHPNTPTFTYLDAKYTSDYIAFQSRELSDRSGNKLQDPTSEQEGIFKKYNPAGNIPFVYYAGKYFSVGASLDQGSMDGKDIGDVTKALKDPNDDISQAIDGTANVMTAGICQATGGKPGSVCNAPGVKAAAKKLPGSADAAS